MNDFQDVLVLVECYIFLTHSLPQRAFAFLGIGSLLSPLLLLVAAPKTFVISNIFHRFCDFLQMTQKQGMPGWGF